MNDFQWNDEKVVQFTEFINTTHNKKFVKALLEEFKEQEQYCPNFIINGEKVKIDTVVWICNEYDSKRYLLHSFKKEWWYIQKNDTYIKDRKYFLTEKEIDDYIALHEKKYSKQNIIDSLEKFDAPRWWSWKELLHYINQSL